MRIEKAGEPRNVWLECPHCHGLFYVERLFYEPRFDHLKVFCPYCKQEFDKYQAPRAWGR